MQASTAVNVNTGMGGGAQVSRPGPGQPAPQAQPQQGRPGQPAPQGQPAPTGQAAPQGKPVAPSKPAPNQAPALPPFDAAGVKTRLRGEYPELQSDADFVAAKFDSIASQGLRFKVERTSTDVNLSFIAISKKGGLIRPAYLVAPTKKVSKEITIFNQFTGRPFLTIKHSAAKKGWEVANLESPGVGTGLITVTQKADVRTVTFGLGSPSAASVSFHCPVQASGCCSSAKPAKLYNINFVSAFKGIEVEENPNGEPCTNDLEINLYYKPAHDTVEFCASVAILAVAGLELK